LEVALTDEQRGRLLRRLDELRQGWNRSYLFFTRNCTHFPEMLLEYALDEELAFPRIYGPDALLAALDRKGLLTHVPATELIAFSAEDQSRVAERLRASAAVRLRSTGGDDAEALDVALRQLERRRPEERALGYRALAEAAIASDSTAVHADAMNFITWSEPWEARRSRRQRDGAPTEVQDAIWRALQTLSGDGARAARGGDVGRASLALTQALDDEVHAAASAPGSPPTHTPLRRISLSAGARVLGTTVVPTLRESSALYHARLGEQRTYATARGLDLLLLHHQLELARPNDRPVELGGALTTLRVRRVLSERSWMNAGWYGELSELARYVAPASWPNRWDFLEGGGLLELGQAEIHRAHAGITVGLVGGAKGQGSLFLRPDAWNLGAAVPVRAFGRLGSARNPMTGLDLRSELRLPVRAEEAMDWTAQVGGQLALGSVRGTALALTLEVEAAQQIPPSVAGADAIFTAPVIATWLGLWLERY